MKFCESCHRLYDDDANFCGQCGRPLPKGKDSALPGEKSSPLLGNLCLGSEFVDGYTRSPLGIRVRAGGNMQVFYDHESREVHFSESFYGGGEKKESQETLPIPPEITTKEELVDYVRRERPFWRLNRV